MFDELDKSEVQAIHDGLKPLFEQAEKEQLWFWNRYQSMWFTPAELREQQAEGKWVWGAPNWTLRHPSEELTRLYQATLILVRSRPCAGWQV